MADISNIIDEIQTTCATPERALQLMDALPSADSFAPDDRDSGRIFLSYFLFFIKKRSNGKIIGIWDKLMCKIVKYYKQSIVIGGDFGDFIGAHSWLDPILRSKTLCPNPYTRLELFRLGRLFELRYWPNTDTFIDTISQIKPQRFYPSGKSDDLLFDVIDLHYILTKRNNMHFIRESLTYEINRQQNDGHEIIKCDFILNCIHLLGIFAAKASSNFDDPKKRAEDLDLCCVAFADGVCLSVSYISDIINKQPYVNYVIEFMRNISVGASTLRHASMCYDIINDVRNKVVKLPGKTNHLPKLLLNRQITESRHIQQNYLLDSTIKYYMALKQPFSIIEKLLSLESTFVHSYRSIRDNESDTSHSDSYPSLNSGSEEWDSDNSFEDDTTSDDDV